MNKYQIDIDKWSARLSLVYAKKDLDSIIKNYVLATTKKALRKRRRNWKTRKNWNTFTEKDIKENGFIGIYYGADIYIQDCKKVSRFTK